MNNIYDNEDFFKEYAQMSRSQEGLHGAGEWWQLKNLFPDLKGKHVLDLGCGYGWHCKFAAEQGADKVLGIDQSQRMLETAKAKNADEKIEYRLCGLESYEYPAETWDFVISNLVLHYIADIDNIYQKVYRTLKPGGVFVFNIEHPTFTSGVNQEWVCDESGAPQFWPVDNYFYSGERTACFLGREVKKQHHTLTEILMGLLRAGFILEAVEEAEPSGDMLDIPGMKDELRRPMMLMVRAVKKADGESCYSSLM